MADSTNWTLEAVDHDGNRIVFIPTSTEFSSDYWYHLVDGTFDISAPRKKRLWAGGENPERMGEALIRETYENRTIKMQLLITSPDKEYIRDGFQELHKFAHECGVYATYPPFSRGHWYLKKQWEGVEDATFSYTLILAADVSPLPNLYGQAGIQFYDGTNYAVPVNVTLVTEPAWRDIAPFSGGTVAVNIVTNGDMEHDGYWTAVGTPTTSEQTTSKYYDVWHSWKFTVDAANEGIKSSTFTTVTGNSYTGTAYVYPDDSRTVQVRIRNGDDSGYVYVSAESDLTQDAWNEVTFSYTETAGGSGAYIDFDSGTETSGTWYIDSVSIVGETKTVYLDGRSGDNYVEIPAANATGDIPPLVELYIRGDASNTGKRVITSCRSRYGVWQFREKQECENGYVNSGRASKVTDANASGSVTYNCYDSYGSATTTEAWTVRGVMGSLNQKSFFGTFRMVARVKSSSASNTGLRGGFVVGNAWDENYIKDVGDGALIYPTGDNQWELIDLGKFTVEIPPTTLTEYNTGTSVFYTLITKNADSVVLLYLDYIEAFPVDDGYGWVTRTDAIAANDQIAIDQRAPGIQYVYTGRGSSSPPTSYETAIADYDMARLTVHPGQRTRFYFNATDSSGVVQNEADILNVSIRLTSQRLTIA